MSDKCHDNFAILMCVFNGDKYLIPQIESILAQKVDSWSIYASDDGSNDTSTSILRYYQEKLGDKRVIISNGPRNGFSKNFLSLLTASGIEASYYALCDQDDIWDREKLRAAQSFFEQHDPKIPALYCGRTIFVDEIDRPIGHSATPSRALCFKNALVQNIASGNTMVINNAARNLLINCGSDLNIYAHDWFLYIIVAAADGKIYYDNRPYVRYRQHRDNLIGMNISLKNKIHRFSQLMYGEFSDWNDRNLKVLQSNLEIISKNNIHVLEEFSAARSNRGVTALYHLIRSGVYRQKAHQNIALYLSATLGWL
jgi:glycosyltransferase involved in cell wall biosynthesis